MRGSGRERGYTVGMNTTPRRAFILSALLLAACATADSRIKKNQAAFDSYAPEVQEKIRKGVADVGFTEEQVCMALGRPDRVYSRKTETASQQVWAYTGASPGGVGLGFGMSSGGGGIGYGLGVGTGSSGYGEIDDKVRVVFEGGKVVDVQTRLKAGNS